MIVGVDLNLTRKALVEKFVMTHLVTPEQVARDHVPYLAGLTKGGAD
jgi:Zn-dependent alcohol dehydrogenase